MKKVKFVCNLMAILVIANSVFAHDMTHVEDVESEKKSFSISRTFHKKDCDEDTWNRLLIVTHALEVLNKAVGACVLIEPGDGPFEYMPKITQFIIDQLKDANSQHLVVGNPETDEIAWSFSCSRKDKSETSIDDAMWKKLCETMDEIKEVIEKYDGPITIDWIIGGMEIVERTMKCCQSEK